MKIRSRTKNDKQQSPSLPIQPARLPPVSNAPIEHVTHRLSAKSSQPWFRRQSDNIPARKEKKKVAANVQSSVDERRVAKKFLRIHHVNGGGVYS
eukprot:scaffold906_cov151-Amphora_coffeaeformis.AAC.4